MSPAVRFRPWLAMPVMLALLSGCGGASANEEARIPAQVEAIIVGPAGTAPSIGAGRDFPAVLRHDRESNLSFRVGGTLTAAPLRPGMTIAAGALVARIDATPYAAALAGRSAEASRLARAADRYAALVPEGAVAQAQAEDARDALAAARAAQVAARYDAASTRLVAPFPGIVLARRAEIGETVAAGQPVAVLADLRSPLLAIADLPAASAARLRPGAPAQVLVPGGGAAMAARVLRVGAASDARSGTVAVELRFAGTPPRLPSGTTVTVRLAEPADGAAGTPSAPGAALVPATALLEAQGSKGFVYVIDGAGKARRRPVRFLGFEDQQARVAGLAAGARVITAGAGFVSEGQSVQVSRP